MELPEDCPARETIIQRRSTGTVMGGIADSAFLKVLQYMVTAVFLPIIAWAVTNTASRLGDIEVSLHKVNVLNATYELRMNNAERALIERSVTINQLYDKVIVLEQEVRSTSRVHGKP